MKHIYSIILFIVLFIGGCTQNQAEPYPAFDDLSDVHYNVYKNGSIGLQKTYRTSSGKSYTIHKKNHKWIERVPVFEQEHLKPISLQGTPSPTDIYTDGDHVKVAVEDIPINEFIDLVLGGVLKVNYTVTPKIQKMKDKVSLNMQKAQNAQEFYKVFKEILSIHGISIYTKNGVKFVDKSKKKNKTMDMKELYIGYGKNLPTNLDDNKKVMLFIPISYIKPNKLKPIFKEAGIGSIKYQYLYKDIPMLIGKASDIKKALSLIKMLDRPAIEGKTPYLISLDNIETKKFVKQMKNIFKLNGIDTVSYPSPKGIVMMPIEELNMVYIISPKKSWIKTVMFWKKKLDIVSEEEDIEPRLYIYHVKNRKADDLAQAINDLLSISINKKRKSYKTKLDLDKDDKKKTQPILEDKDSLIFNNLNYKPNITADKDTNILMLKLLPSHYHNLLPFIKELDKLPLQTLVEVTVAEVTMTDTFSLGFEYAIRNHSADLIKQTLDISGGGSGLGIVFKGNYIDATVNAFAKKQLLNIISKPKMLIMNNNTGTINVGTQVPIITSEVSASDVSSSTGTSPSINRNITYRTTGINLGVTPTINSNGILTMKINVSLSEAQLNDTSGIDSPLIVNRNLSTVAVIRSGDTILIGGLISKNKSSGHGGIPLLKDLPYIGDAFASQSDKATKTELIMLIRPIIIQSADGMSNISYKYKKVLEYMSKVSL